MKESDFEMISEGNCAENLMFDCNVDSEGMLELSCK